MNWIKDDRLNVYSDRIAYFKRMLAKTTHEDMKPPIKTQISILKFTRKRLKERISND